MVRSASAGNVPDPSGGNDYFYEEANFPLLLQAQLEVVAQAHDLQRGADHRPHADVRDLRLRFRLAGAPGSHHSDAFHSGYQASPGAQYNSPITVDNLLAAARAPFATAQKWFATQLVNKVVSLLATTDDPGRRGPGARQHPDPLDEEIGDGNDHNRVSEILYPQVPDSLPLVTIGSGAGAIKSGLVVQYPIATNSGASGVNRMARICT